MKKSFNFLEFWFCLQNKYKPLNAYLTKAHRGILQKIMLFKYKEALIIVVEGKPSSKKLKFNLKL